MIKQVKYAIMTENVNPFARSLCEKYIAKYFPGFSVYEQTGFWEGLFEQSLCHMTITDKESEHLILEVAERIRSLNCQEAVLVVKTKVRTELV